MSRRHLDSLSMNCSYPLPIFLLGCWPFVYRFLGIFKVLRGLLFSGLWVVDIFSRFVTWFLTLFMVYFYHAEGFVFMWSTLSSFYFKTSVFGVTFRKPFPLQGYKAVSPCFPLVFYVFLFCFTFKSLTRLEFILVCSVSYGSNSISSQNWSIFSRWVWRPEAVAIEGQWQSGEKGLGQQEYNVIDRDGA